MKHKTGIIIVVIFFGLQFITGCDWFRDQFVMDSEIVQDALTSILSEDVYSIECLITATCQTEIKGKNDYGTCELEDINTVFFAIVDRINRIIKIKPSDSERILYLAIADDGLNLYIFTAQGHIITQYHDPQLVKAVSEIFFTHDPSFLQGEGSGFAENEVRTEYDYASDRTIESTIFYRPFELISDNFVQTKPPLTIMIYLDESDENSQVIIDTINYADSGFTELFEFCYYAYTQRPLENTFTENDVDYIFKCSIILKADSMVSSVVLPNTEQ